ncbi:MAG: M15 family metallopeptidase [Candidatus Paceibacterota bacterium]
MNMNKIPEIKPTKSFLSKYATIEIISIITLILIASAGYEFYTLSSKINSLSQNLDSLETRYASTTETLKNAITQTRTEFSTALSQNVGDISSKLGAYQSQVGSITSTVSTLQKLSKVDKELLQKYSKVFFLNEYYAPARFAEIPDAYKYSDSKTLKVEIHVLPFLKRMIDDAAKENINLYVSSAFRSFSEQSSLKGQYKVIYGAGTANSFSADQGYSEHQLGTTVDLTTVGLNGNLDGFENTKAYTWLLANAYRYGFILSYPQNNNYFVFEPWHWRFVGVILATDLRNGNKNFYDMDQRNIDEYLVSLFD